MSDITVLLLSYGRPNWILEAASSCAGADSLIVVDDGSLFDVRSAVRADHYVTASPLDPEERLVNQRLSSLINSALDLVTTEYVTYLCDDDLFADGWLQACREQTAELVIGDWWHWDHGDWGGRRPMQIKDASGMTTGNFAHKPGVARWIESAHTMHDALFCPHLARKARSVARLNVVAGYRREHARNTLLVAGSSFLPEAEEWFAEDCMETA